MNFSGFFQTKLRTVLDIIEILEAKLRGMSTNDVAHVSHCLKHSVQDVEKAAARLGILLGVPELTDEGLYRLFFPERNNQDDLFQV